MEENINDGMREECAVFGCVSSGPWPNPNVDVAGVIYNGLIGLQHRGQESSGIVVGSGEKNSCKHVREQFIKGSSATENFLCKEPQCELDSSKLRSKKGMGLVGSVFKEDDIRYLKGNLGIGHNRYSTAGPSDMINCQPLQFYTKCGEIALAHNGEIVNAPALRNELFARGAVFTADSDTEMIAQALMADERLPPSKSPEFHPLTSSSSRNGTSHNECNGMSNGCGQQHEDLIPYGTPSPTDLRSRGGDPEWGVRILDLMTRYPLAYSFLLLHKDAIYAVRDCFGNRPLSLGRIRLDDDSGQVVAWLVASETCCFKDFARKTVKDVFLREVLPGEVVKITATGFETVGRAPPKLHVSRKLTTAFCVFEYVYFARGDSFFEGQQVYRVREECGRQLARESVVEADVVSNVPDSATAAAHGFARESGIPYVEVLTKNNYVGRTFIQPSNRLRQSAVSRKFGALTENLDNKRIILIDDSIVRGNTLRTIVKLLRDSGAKEVHVRAACPPVRHPCYMGVNIPTRNELIANQMSAEELPHYLGADSVAYLSIDGLLRAVKKGAKPPLPSENPQADCPWEKVEAGHCTACLTGVYPVELMKKSDIRTDW
ncbi:hypothetical protein RvY_03927 [Ramazzottius varieornatus]|uniref:Amidophosphoribosyltransferase n=1 Tax=Ramazzottius varieornatus TaxID=947166 RepID=A0A1D1UVF2_RAMVA|nr:hypothetical protein RvY_03927 [Ramazzottius varieornatus]